MVTACTAGLDPGEVRETGQLSFGLTLAEGFTVTEVRYTLSHPDGLHRTGTIPLAGPDGAIAALFVLPAARSYSLSLVATLLDDTTCAGSSEFDIWPDRKTEAGVILRCPGRAQAAPSGAVEVDAQLNVCPVVQSVAADRPEAAIGRAIRLESLATDADGGPAALAHAWSASSGVLRDPAAASTPLLCTAVGPSDITLRVSDGDPGCDPAAVTISVQCTAAPTNGTGAAGAAATAGEPGVETPDETDAGVDVERD